MNNNKDINILIEKLEQTETKEFYSMKEVLQLLNITDTTLYKYIERGHLTKIKLLGRTWFRGSELKNYINSEVLIDTVSK
jgi:excisionase family DNA binding protein